MSSFIKCVKCSVGIVPRLEHLPPDVFRGICNQCFALEYEQTLEKLEIKELKSELSELTSENANLKNRLSQLEAYLKEFAPHFKIFPFAEIVANHKHPFDMDEAEMDAYARQLNRSYAVGNLKSGNPSDRCLTCGTCTERCDC